MEMSGLQVSLITYLITIIISFAVAVIIKLIVFLIHRYSKDEIIEAVVSESDDSEVAIAVALTKNKMNK